MSVESIRLESKNRLPFLRKDLFRVSDEIVCTFLLRFHSSPMHTKSVSTGNVVLVASFKTNVLLVQDL